MTLISADERFKAQAQALGFDVNADIHIGGNYTSVMKHGDEIYVSGQIPRIGKQVMAVGCVGQDISVSQAHWAAQICVVRALTLLHQQIGSLTKVKQILRITVYVRSAPDFTMHSEVADGASDLLFGILGDAGRHTRTTVGVIQLPKGAAIELDLIAAI
jgi:enamine deaminase RidA (YjgF/YER057c/UK114 family)